MPLLEHDEDVAAALATPRVYLSEGRAAFLGPSMRLSPHKLAVATVVIALERPFRLEMLGEAGAPSGHRRIGVIPPDRMHHLRSDGLMLFLYLDALSDDYRALDAALLDALDADPAPLRADVAAAPPASGGALIAAVCARLALPDRAPPDPRIAAALGAIDRAPQDFPRIEQAAAIAGLSAPRFQHLFRDAVGTPFRRYRLWARMAIVARRLAAGAALTDAALDAGFSSSAHLSAAFRTMFGIKPSDLIGGKSRFIVDAVETDRNRA